MPNVRAQRLQLTAQRQIAELAEVLASADEGTLTLPCPGRAKLGDGTVGAVAAHTTDNYERIARFVDAVVNEDTGHAAVEHGAYRASRVELDVLIARVAVAKRLIPRLAQLDDERLDSVPAPGGMRFADGKRTFHDVVTSLLKHQRHQLDALAAASSA